MNANHNFNKLETRVKESKYFPHPSQASTDGLIAVGGEYSYDMLMDAYTHGIFPWPHDGYPLLWFSPDPRGILDFSDLHISKSLNKVIKKNFINSNIWSRTVNTCFKQVMIECKNQMRPGQNGTWINDELIVGYEKLFKRGNAVSVEIWEGKELIGGIYGVLSKNYFSAESMFHKKSDASKVAFLELVKHLKEKQFTWMDIQMVTPVTQALGGKYISRSDFLDRITS